MRFITFDKNGVETVGIRMDEESLIDLSIAAPSLPLTLLGLIQAGKLAEAGDAAENASAEARRPLQGLKYLPVIPNPPKIAGFGANYRSHAGERPKDPPLFLSGATRLVGHDQQVVIPLTSDTLDYETELAVVIGREAKNVSAQNALDYVAGYTVFNDVSVRGHGGGLRLTLMKGCDDTGPFGPELVTPDELPPGCKGLAIQTRRDGKVVQDDNTDNMYWDVAEVIEMVSSYMTLEAGAVIATGSCGGTVADTHKHWVDDPDDPSLPWLKPGEVVESEVESVGVLRATIVSACD